MTSIGTWCPGQRHNLQKSCCPEKLCSYLQLAFPFSSVYLSLCYSYVLSYNKYVPFLYKASSSESAEWWQQDSYNSKAGPKPLPLCWIYAAEAPHCYAWELGNTNTLATTRKPALSPVIETLLCVLSCTYLLSWLEEMCIAAFFIWLIIYFNRTENLNQSQL